MSFASRSAVVQNKMRSRYSRRIVPISRSTMGCESGRIVIRAEIFGQTVPANRAIKHPAQRHSINNAVVDAKTNDATRKLVHHNKNPVGSQRCRFASESIAAPQTVLGVTQKRKPGRTSRI